MKVILKDGTTFTILKYDQECNLALLKNDNSPFYNVVTGLNDDNTGYRCSLLYSENYNEVKERYILETMNNFNYEKIKVKYFLLENYPLHINEIDKIVDFAYQIYLSYDDEDLEKLSEYLVKKFCNEIDEMGITEFEESKLYLLNKSKIIEMYLDDTIQ